MTCHVSSSQSQWTLTAAAWRSNPLWLTPHVTLILRSKRDPIKDQNWVKNYADEPRRHKQQMNHNQTAASTTGTDWQAGSHGQRECQSSLLDRVLLLLLLLLLVKDHLYKILSQAHFTVSRPPSPQRSHSLLKPVCTREQPGIRRKPGFPRISAVYLEVIDILYLKLRKQWMMLSSKSVLNTWKKVIEIWDQTGEMYNTTQTPDNFTRRTGT